MKKVLLTVMLLIGLSLTTSAQSLEEFMTRFSAVENAEVVNLDKEQIQALLSAQQEDAEEESGKMDVLKSLETINVIDLEECGETDRLAFCEAAANLRVDGLDTLVETNEDDGLVRILGKMDGSVCKELVVFSAEKAEPAFVRIVGELDLQKMKNAQGGDFNLINIDGVTFP